MWPRITFENIPTRIPIREPQLVEQLVEVPTVLFYVEQNIDIPDRQGFLPEQSPTLGLRLRGGFKVSSQDRVPQRFWTLRRSIFNVFFALFPQLKKSARVSAHSSAELGAHSTSSTMSAHQMAHLDAGTNLG